MPAPRKASRTAAPDHDRDNLTATARKVSQDVTKGLGRFFKPTGGFEIASGFQAAEPITNGSHTAVVWEYSGVHTREFQGIAPTGLPVVIRGVTVIFQAPKEPMLYHRYIDWADVMAQLGLSTTSRPALEALPSAGG